MLFWKRTAKKCTNIYNACGWPLFCSLNLLTWEVLAGLIELSWFYCATDVSVRVNFGYLVATRTLCKFRDRNTGFYDPFINLMVVANKSKMLRTQIFLCFPSRATFVADTKFVSETHFFQKHFVFATNVFPFALLKIIMSNIVPTTMCLR